LSGRDRRRLAVLLAVAGAVVLSLLLGLYVGWRQEPEPVLRAEPSTPAEPLKLRLEHRLAARNRR
jgi:hypothetical protein